MKYQDDPRWNYLRKGLLITFWVGLMAIFLAACLISYFEQGQMCAPKMIPLTLTGTATNTNAVTPLLEVFINISSTDSSTIII